MQLTTRIGAVLVLLCISCVAEAQVLPRVPAIPPKDTSMFLFFKDVTAGPFFTGGISRQNVNLPGIPGDTINPWHGESRFAYSLGGSVQLSINKWVGLSLSLFYDARDIYLADRGDSDNIDFSIGYVGFEPSIRIAWLLIGLAFDIPMSGNATMNVAQYHHTSQPLGKYSQNLDVNTGDLNMITELRATLQIPILESENGEVYAVVRGSYPLSAALKTKSPTFDTTGRDYGTLPTDTKDPLVMSHFSGDFAPAQGPLPSIQAGITYQFDILH